MSSIITLDCMPADIQHDIISELSSCRDSIKALRQTSRRFADTCAAHLFSSVHISALKRDRESFLQVAASPHLACHVKTLVWEEITGDFKNFEPASLHRVFGIDDETFASMDWEEDRGLFEDLAAQSKGLFWLTSEHVEAEMRRRKSFCRSNTTYEPDMPFWNDFMRATRAFPNLYTLVSRPMHPDRDIQLAADNCYPLTARFAFKFLHWTKASFTRTDTLFNIGFIFYLIPLLSFHCGEGDLRIRSLSFSDESMIKRTALKDLNDHDADAFSNICHMELRVTDYIQKNSALGRFNPSDRGWGACLGKAAKLTGIHISCDIIHGVWEPSETSNEAVDSVTWTYSLMAGIPTLPALQSASFENVVFKHIREKRDEMSVHPQPDLVDFVKRHASTLRELQIIDGMVTKETIEKLAADPKIRLERFVNASCGEDNGEYLASEQQLLNIINRDYDLSDPRTVTSIKPGTEVFDAVQRLHRKPQRTHYVTPRDDGTLNDLSWSLRQRILHGEKTLMDGEVVDTSTNVVASHPRDLELHEQYRVFQPTHGLWKDENGMLYNPITDNYHVDSPHISPQSQQSLPVINDWKIRNGRRWDDNMGLWVELEPSESWRLHKHCGNWSYCDKIHDKHDGDPAAAGSLCELSAGPLNMSYMEEDFEQIARHEHAAKWRFGRDWYGRVWYWQVYDLELSGYETLHWNFKHRNGEVAFGEDPLEFWEDWEGYQSGDKAEPTPFVKELYDFSRQLEDKGWPIAPPKSDEITGWHLPCDEGIGRLFGEPIAYRESDDLRRQTNLRELYKSRRKARKLYY
ncbi:hypothetical protein E4U55_005536 [Claviceps digitariae]|nr:hypothetical protein E4U55_005536 [Claviceps digitariae]